ncbi:MAG TPA: hypothetical protein PLD25_06585 [Chloroflexota bacterium]|nr:hypothetical protein [Chloroflexota bacterium]
MTVRQVIKGKLSGQEAVGIAQEFVADYLTDLMGVGVPWRMQSPLGRIWVVPVWIAYPGFEQPATIGSIAVDENSGTIISWTPIEEMKANAAQFHAINSGQIVANFSALPKN